MEERGIEGLIAHVLYGLVGKDRFSCKHRNGEDWKERKRCPKNLFPVLLCKPH